MSLIDSKGMLTHAGKDLLLRWEDVRRIWSDAQSQEFEKTYLTQLQQDTKAALAALEQMNHILQRLESDCE
jgi:hypothetical protein